MDANERLRFLERQIHSVILATVDEHGLPVTCAVDLMDHDEKGLYFLTAKGKRFYRRLKQNGYVALTGLKGSDTLSCVAVSIRGKVREIGAAPLPKLFSKNPYMNELYPTEQSRQALTVFCLYEGDGEWLDLSKKPIERAPFTIGAGRESSAGYEVTESCTGCGICKTVCPQNCIDLTATPAAIEQAHCLHCGNCFESCPQKAVTQRR